MWLNDTVFKDIFIMLSYDVVVVWGRTVCFLTIRLYLKKSLIAIYDVDVDAVMLLIICDVNTIEEQMLKEGYPAYTTSCAWLGYTDQQLTQVLLFIYLSCVCVLL